MMKPFLSHVTLLPPHCSIDWASRNGQWSKAGVSGKRSLRLLVTKKEALPPLHIPKEQFVDSV